VAVFAEHLDAPQAWPGEVVVPHAGERADGPVDELDGRRGYILDAVVPMKVGGVRADALDVANEVAEHVDVVDAVFQQRAGAHQRAVRAPGGGVVALDRDELIVAEHHAHHSAGRRVVDEVASPQERR
jgi:hypothetical protein